MQEDIEHRSVTLAINTTKMTARALKNAILKFLSQSKQNNRASTQDIQSKGKQSVKKLIGQGQCVSNIDITGSNIKFFKRVARKYGVDYALRKDTTGTIPKYLVFFKARDADALTAAFKEYSGKSIKREKIPSVLANSRSSGS